MRVDEVVGCAGAVGAGVLGDEGFDAGAELLLHGVDLEGCERSGRAGVDVDDADVAVEGDGGGQVRGVAAGEDVDVATGATQLAGECGDVDVHAAGLGGAGYGQGRGVGAEEGEALEVMGHQAPPPVGCGVGRRSCRVVTGVGFAPS